MRTQSERRRKGCGGPSFWPPVKRTNERRSERWLTKQMPSLSSERRRKGCGGPSSEPPVKRTNERRSERWLTKQMPSLRSECRRKGRGGPSSSLDLLWNERTNEGANVDYQSKCHLSAVSAEGKEAVGHHLLTSCESNERKSECLFDASVVFNASEKKQCSGRSCWRFQAPVNRNSAAGYRDNILRKKR